MIEVRGVAKYFGRFSALRGLEVRIERGQFVSVFGRNGAGKTTLLRILAGLTRPSSGTVRVGEASLSPQAARGRMGYLSHSTALYADLTALENLRFYARLLDLPSDQESLEERLAGVGLAGRGKDPVRNYSRGMQQRLAIARAFLHDPEILLLDEPFTGLDQEGTEFLRCYLLELHGKGRTCVMAIHDIRLGFDMADRLLVLEEGAAAIDVARRSVSFEEFQRRFRGLAQERHDAV